MKSYFKRNIISLVKSKYFYFTISILIFTGYITLLRNSNLYMLNEYKPIGAVNLFIYSNIRGNTITSIFSPIFITFPILVIMSNNKETIGGKYLFWEILSISILAIIVIVFTYSLSYIFCILISPHPSNTLPIVYHGLFVEVYNQSLFLYTIAYVIHSIICGIVFSVFAYCIYYLSDDFFFALVIPNAYYYLSLSCKGIFTGKLLKISNYILPTLFYDLNHTQNIAENVTQILTMLLLSFSFFIFGYLKKRRRFDDT